MNPATYMTTVKRIREFEPDVLVIGYWMPYMAPALGYVAKKMSKHCRVVSIVHNATPHEQGKMRSEEHTSELQSRPHLVCRLLLEKKKKLTSYNIRQYK